MRRTSICWYLILCTILLTVVVFCNASAQENQYIFAYRSGSYAAYNEQYAAMSCPSDEILLHGPEGIPDDDTAYSIQIVDGREAMCWEKEQGSISWTFTAAESGRYALAIDYYAFPGDGNPPEYELRLDGEVPFLEAQQLHFTRLFQDETDDFARDRMGNDLRPSQQEIFGWQTSDLYDINGYVNGSYLFALEAGEHMLTLTAIREPMAIASLRFYNAAEPISYAEYSAGNTGKPAGVETIIIEAEHALNKTSTMLYPIPDRSDPMTSPSDPVAKRLNTIGGENWATADQTITWSFDVPADGLYNITLRFRQNNLRGMLVYRRVQIDGETIFGELKQIAFPYGVSWQVSSLGGDTPFEIWLTQGTHTITMTPTTGDMAPLMARVDSVVNDLNTMYRRIIMITSTTPDLYRDYFLQDAIPGLMDSMRILATELRNVEAQVQQMTGFSGTEAASLVRLAEQLESFIARPGTIPSRLTAFRDNIVTISTWMQLVCKQSLQLDLIYISPAGKDIPRMTSSFFENLGYQAKAVVGSFSTDYETVGNAGEGDTVIDVWIASGRDQAEVLKELIDSSFTPLTGIGVNLSIVQNGLMQAAMADAGPDVTIMLGRGDPVNYALRGAVLALDEFEGFDELISEYMTGAMTPFYWNEHYWGLPNTQNFYVMFYRTDVFEELGIAAPETWDELLAVAEILHRNNMNIGLPYVSLDAYQSVSTGVGGSTLFPTLLLQRGIGLYTEDRMTTTLDTPEALTAFKLWTSLYTQYGFPLYKNDFNRFRSGEMPLVITNYTFYSQLKTAAPDIRNLWKMALIPGTVRSDGTVSRATAASGTAGMILANTKEAEASWKFLRWWNKSETQVAYGQQIENVLGPAGRYNPANVKAMQSMRWSGAELEIIMEQWRCVEELPELPGSYYVSRNIDNAFKEVYNDQANVRETLNYWTKQINEELERKRNEFTLPQNGGESK